MSAQFFPKLSQNYIEMLDDGGYYDITIEVGKGQNVKIFRAHMIILRHRSPFLRRILANKKDKVDVLIQLPNILPEIFQSILKYIYGGIISLNEYEPLDILKVLITANELLLLELVEYLQKYLIEKKSDWMEKHFELIRMTSLQFNSLSELQQFCTDLMSKSPEKVFRSLDFTSITEKSLISLLKRNDLVMKEVEIWEHMLEWGLQKHPTLISNPITWSDNDFKIMESTLQNCLPLIRFFSLSSEEFIQKVHPYKKLLNLQLYEDLLNSYLNPSSEPSEGILLPRCRIDNEIIDTKIVDLNIVSIISRWIDKLDIKSKFVYARELYLPYQFKLLLRGSRDGFTPKKFHELCDNMPHTVTFIKVKETNEILGGYNPSIWQKSKSKNLRGEWGQTKDSFIFSFKNTNSLKSPIISHIDIIDVALFYYDHCGPSFCNDLYVSSTDKRDYNYNYCYQDGYEKQIRDTQEIFSIEEYEVFQILKNEA